MEVKEAFQALVNKAKEVLLEDPEVVILLDQMTVTGKEEALNKLAEVAALDVVDAVGLPAIQLIESLKLEPIRSVGVQRQSRKQSRSE